MVEMNPYEARADAISRLTKAKGADWNTALKAFDDAAKLLRPKKKRGLPSDDPAASEPTIAEVYQRALMLLDEPARQPKAVKGLARIKKESGLPLKACRQAMAEANYDPDRALELLRANPKLPKPNIKRACPKLTRTVNTALAHGHDCLMVVTRQAILTKEQQAVSRDLARNGEHPGPVADQCLMWRDKSGWKRIGRFYRAGDPVWGAPSSCVVTPDGGIHYLISTRADESRNLVTAVVSRTGPAAEPIRYKFPIIANHLVGGDHGLITSVLNQTELWVRPGDGPWRALALPDGDRSTTGLAARGGRFWAGSRHFFGYHDGNDWKAVPGYPQCNPPPAEFSAIRRLAFGPDDTLAFICGRDIWLGTQERVERAMTYVEADSLEFVGDTLYYNRGDAGVFARCGNAERKVFDPVPAAYGKKRTPRLFVADNKLCAFTNTTLYEKDDADDWSETALTDLWEALGHDDLWWTTEPPDWWPPAPNPMC